MHSASVQKTKVHFLSSVNLKLSGQWIESPGHARVAALFANCFTCSKQVKATQWIGQALAASGISVFAFDPRGLGESEGDFAQTTLETMREDYRAAVQAMRQRLQAPQLLIGHSIGGVLSVQMAPEIPEAKGVVTLAAPSFFREVLRRIRSQIPHLANRGSGTIEWGGERFPIRQTLVDSLQGADIRGAFAALRLPLLVIHSIRDEVLDFQNAIDLFEAAGGPKSFVGLRYADHLFHDRLDARYAAGVICDWGRTQLSL